MTPFEWINENCESPMQEDFGDESSENEVLKIKADQKEIQDQIDALELKSREIEDINKKEDLYKEIDTLKDERYAIEVKTLENR